MTGGEIVVDAPPAFVEPVVDDFEAIRIMALRLDRREQSGVVSFAIGQSTGSSWRAEVVTGERKRDAGRLLTSGERVLISTAKDSWSTKEVALEAMSDVGALEVAGHSIARPQKPSWVPEHPRESTAPTAPEAISRVRKGLARALQQRVRSNAKILKEAGFDFSADGWDLVVRFVWPEPPDASRHPDAFAASLENFAGGRVKGYLPGR